MKLFIRHAYIVYLALGLLTAGCASTETTTCSSTSVQHVSDNPKFVHAVFFTFKPEVTHEQIEEFIRDCNRLKQIPAVKKLDAGGRDTRLQRDVNVTDYQVGLVVYFNDKAGHDEYSNHPLHNELVAKHKEKWASVRVFDFDAK